MAFADPPFNLKKKYNSYKDKMELEEYVNWCGRWIGEMVRVTKPSGAIFVHNIPKWLAHYVKFLNECADFKHWIAWQAPTSPMGKSLQPGHYGILFYVKDRKQAKIYEIRMPHERERKSLYLRKDYGGKKAGLHPFGPLVSDVWTDIHRIKHNKYRDEHPCQLPVALLERLILMTTDEGDVVLDPFMGTGTTAVATKKLGRNYIGFDLDKKYKSICENNLRKVAPDSRVGESWVSFHLGEIRTLRDQDWADLSDYFEIPDNAKDIDFVKIRLQKEKCGGDNSFATDSLRNSDFGRKVAKQAN
ncbi:MAG: site-specific DNA-methyltransferase [Gammaproteobacteria bacterium]|nr:site-specific DNA-methyltransferase [Gammaproteobacteria bacterium]